MLTQARPELIERTYEAIEGAPRAIVHLYNSTSKTQRRVVFRLDRDGIIELAVGGAALCKALAGQTDTHVVFQYSPESFHHTSSSTRSRSARRSPRSGGRPRTRG